MLPELRALQAAYNVAPITPSGGPAGSVVSSAAFAVAERRASRRDAASAPGAGQPAEPGHVPPADASTAVLAQMKYGPWTPARPDRQPQAARWPTAPAVPSARISPITTFHTLAYDCSRRRVQWHFISSTIRRAGGADLVGLTTASYRHSGRLPGEVLRRGGRAGGTVRVANEAARLIGDHQAI
jgi:hypothetical protein